MYVAISAKVKVIFVKNKNITLFKLPQTFYYETAKNFYYETATNFYYETSGNQSETKYVDKRHCWYTNKCLILLFVCFREQKDVYLQIALCSLALVSDM